MNKAVQKLGRLGGKSTSEAKAARANGAAPVKDGSRPRGRPKKVAATEEANSKGRLLCFGVPCDLKTWLASPERVMRHVRDGITAREINRSRWGSYVPVRVDVEALKACRRRGLLRCEKGKWFVR